MKSGFGILIAAYCLFLLLVSSGTAPRELNVSFPGLDKATHAALYGALAGMATVGMHASAKPWSRFSLFFAPLLFSSAYGCAMELYQSYLPHRSCDPLDALANALGAFVVQCGWLMLFRGLVRPQS